MRTSVNFRISDLSRIVVYCGFSGLSISQLVCDCLGKYLASGQRRNARFIEERAVEYQPSGLGYSIKNVVLDARVYNLVLNFRDFGRISVSFLVSLALEYFFEQIADKKTQEDVMMHNYVDFHCQMRHFFDKSFIEWNVSYKIKREKEP
ncbi:MAG: hypothetical protein PF637_14310 [Spirochaetes bacterium]|jgi:hypothetical protein|nr:hypothetical protein [Spirochaetota bacterium]